MSDNNQNTRSDLLYDRIDVVSIKKEALKGFIQNFDKTMLSGPFFSPIIKSIMNFLYKHIKVDYIVVTASKKE
ncbi:MAG: hypothetical protein O2794_01495 [bacterium]|nr:hypothetical protein [bacterium]